MFYSVFEIFKVGVGPSSSHTVAPMRAAGMFLQKLHNTSARQGAAAPAAGAGRAAQLRCWLQGSLAFTGLGHTTDRAVCLGLLGFTPNAVEKEAADAALQRLKMEKKTPKSAGGFQFDPKADLIFDYETKPAKHPNTLIFHAYDAQGRLYAQETYCSIGGGFVVTQDELGRPAAKPSVQAPYPFSSASEMLKMGAQSGLSIAQMKRANETAANPSQDLDAGLDSLWETMNASIERA